MRLVRVLSIVSLLVYIFGCKTIEKTSGLGSEYVGVNRQWKPGDIVKVSLSVKNIGEVHFARIAFAGPAEMVPFQTMRKVNSNLEALFEVPKGNRFDAALLAFEIFDNAGDRTILYPKAENFKSAGMDIHEVVQVHDAEEDTKYVEFDAPVVMGMAYDEAEPELVSARLSKAKDGSALIEYVVKDQSHVRGDLEIGVEQTISEEDDQQKVIAQTTEGHFSVCHRTTNELLSCKVKLVLPDALPRKPYISLVLTDLQGNQAVFDSTEVPQKFSIDWPINPAVKSKPLAITGSRVLSQNSDALKIEVTGNGGGGLVHLELIVGAGVELKTVQPKSIDCQATKCVAEFTLPALKELDQAPEADARVFGANGSAVVTSPISGINFQLAKKEKVLTIDFVRFEHASKTELLRFF